MDYYRQTLDQSTTNSYHHPMDNSEKPQKNKGGRPHGYTPEIANKICKRMIEGQSLARICKDEDMPCPSSVYKWLGEVPEFSEKYQRAKLDQADFFVEELLEIPDTEEDVQRAKLKTHVRMWAASKFKPKKYGDRLHQEVTGADGAPLQIPLVVLDGGNKLDFSLGKPVKVNKKD